jgi:hypothetical protein
MPRLHLLVLVAACNTTAHDQPDAPAVPDAATTGPNIVTVELSDTPAFVAYRDGDGPWQTPEAMPANTYTLHVTAAYRFLWVCTYPSGGFDAQLELATLDDGPHAQFFCESPTQTPTVAVTGQMAQAGSVSMTDFAKSATAPWTFHLDVVPGAHELVAASSDRVSIQRDLAIAAAETLPTIDVVANGTALDTVPVTITGVGAGDMLGTHVDLSTTHDYNQVWSGTTSTMRTVPASLLHAGDRQVLWVTASTPTTFRGGASIFTGTETTFAMMPPLTGVSFGPASGGLAAMWSNLPPHSQLDFWLDTFASPVVSVQHVAATKHWLDATGATSLTFDSSAPGYRAEWIVDLAGKYSRTFSATTLVGTTGFFSSEVFEFIAGAVARAPRSSRARLASTRSFAP